MGKGLGFFCAPAEQGIAATKANIQYFLIVVSFPNVTDRLRISSVRLPNLRKN